MTEPHIAIIGGGASGVLMALHLLQYPDFRVTLIEQETGRKLGRGIAYSTDDPDHLLNTRTGNMSAFPDDMTHFQRWLALQDLGPDNTDFVRRSAYGRYLGSLLDSWQGSGPMARLNLVGAEVVQLDDLGRQVSLQLSDGRELRADRAILATGHVVAPDAPHLHNAWGKMGPLDPDGDVLIIGSGLSMVDKVLTLLAQGHRGRIISLSRRGLMPRVHGPVTPVTITDIPWGQPLSQYLRWLRQQIKNAKDWRDVVDGLRPHVAQIWRRLPVHARARFLRHGATWWDVHRHRIPPQSQTVIQDAIQRGQLLVQRGSFISASQRADGQIIAQLGTGTVTVARIIDCRGIRRDAGKNASPLMAHLLASNQGRLDPLRIGLDVDPQCQLIGQDGQSSPRLLAVGPAARAGFWEITAVPDIRVQTAKLAKVLAETHHQNG